MERRSLSATPTLMTVTGDICYLRRMLSAIRQPTADITSLGSRQQSRTTATGPRRTLMTPGVTWSPPRSPTEQWSRPRLPGEVQVFTRLRVRLLENRRLSSTTTPLAARFAAVSSASTVSGSGRTGNTTARAACRECHFLIEAIPLPIGALTRMTNTTVPYH